MERQVPRAWRNSRMQTIFHGEGCSNVVNLSKELELFHIRRKYNFMQRKEVSNRLKT